MTEDYKDIVLKYITGNLQEENPNYDPQFKNIQTITNNLQSQIEANFISRVAYVDFVPSKNNKNQDLEYSVIACRGTLQGEEEESGAFVILDKNYNIVEFISHYSDGSLIGVLYCLNVDDKGNYYAVEQNGNTFRIVLLNNLVLKPIGTNTYQAIKMNIHNIPNQYVWEGFTKVFKNDGGNKYFAIANRDNGDGIVGCELTIEDNDTWKYYTSTHQKNLALSIFDNGYNVYWDSNNDLHFQIAVNYFGLVMLTEGSSITMQETQVLELEGTGANSNFIFYSNVYGYYATIEDTDTTDTTYRIYKIDLSNNNATLIYEQTGLYTLYSWLWLFKNNNSIYFIRTTRTQNDSQEFELSFGLIDDVNAYEQDLGTFTATSFLNAFCYPNVIANFNKNYVYIQNQNTLFSLEFNWNPINYNGTAYTSINSLVPNSIGIEDENEIELFNRNIYNLSNYSNWYTASVQIPNYFLNNDTLSSALLYTKANNLITSAYINTTKNIYEELLINFTNKFNIIDKNKNLENLAASSQLVSAMINKNTQGYLGKYKINYNDETSVIKNLSVNELVYNDLSTTIKLVVYVDKPIDTIELISQDETISYNTIDCSNLEQNKYYLITQDIGIE